MKRKRYTEEQIISILKEHARKKGVRFIYSKWCQVYFYLKKVSGLFLFQTSPTHQENKPDTFFLESYGWHLTSGVFLKGP